MKLSGLNLRVVEVIGAVVVGVLVSFAYVFSIGGLR
jgi:hypothetical protein